MDIVREAVWLRDSSASVRVKVAPSEPRANGPIVTSKGRETDALPAAIFPTAQLNAWLPGSTVHPAGAFEIVTSGAVSRTVATAPVASDTPVFEKMAASDAFVPAVTLCGACVKDAITLTS